MKKFTALISLLLLSGCAPTKPRVISAAPMRAESVGLFLETEPRKGKMGAPFTVLCNVCLRNLNNTSIPLWKFPRTTFYGEQGGQFYALRVIETHSGGLSAPYSMSGISATLPRPPRSGKWNIFAVQEHSDEVYQSHLRDHPPKSPITYVEDQNEQYNGMWTETLVSNVITIEFSEIGQGDMKSAEDVTQGLIDAGQYKTEFRKPMDDPTKGLVNGFSAGAPQAGPGRGR